MTLKELCRIHAPSGCEWRIRNSVLDYITSQSHLWKTTPRIIHDGIHDNLMLVFGKPRVAVFCHMDTTGFTVRYNNHLISIGSPSVHSPEWLQVIDDHGTAKYFSASRENEEAPLLIERKKKLNPGTTLSFKPYFSQKGNKVTSPYLDNRAGVWVCLQLAESIKNGIIVFTTYEEHGGGSVEFLAPLLYNNYQISQALICDMTWTSEEVKSGKGMVVSLRDRYIPRQKYIDNIRQILTKNKIPFQCEVEGSGASDGGYLQKSSVPFDWCFTGAAIDGMHSSREHADTDDLQTLIKGLEILTAKM